VFEVQLLPKFERTTKNLKKSFKSKRQEQQFVDRLTEIIRSLVQEPRDPNSRLEPIPKGVLIPEGWEFRKLVFDVPGTAGAAGEGRLIYLVNYVDHVISLLWLYTHEEFKGRPPDQDLRQLLRDALTEE
jgi:hypothetical protein